MAENDVKFDENEDTMEESEEDRLEREHFQRIVKAFRFYKLWSLKRVKKSAESFKKLPERHKNLLPDFLPHLEKVRVCIDHNYEIIKEIIKNTDHIFTNTNHGPRASSISTAPEMDMEKVRTTLKQFVRDWSSEGKAEREDCYRPILDEIQRKFPPDQCDPGSVKVLVPGAGLGRLAFDIAKLGYTCQGNEFSLFMLFASNFILNRSPGVNLLTLYPYVHSYCNNKHSEDQIRPVTVPDIDPTRLPEGSDFSMAAGDFLEVYTQPEAWDCVATCYFVDTAHNIVAYIETIWKILKPGGYWINLGPLLYHFADVQGEDSIEIGYDVVRRVVQQVGFEILEENDSVPTTYIGNSESMLKYIYHCIFLVCRKPDPIKLDA